jgi:hypothetical protein
MLPYYITFVESSTAFSLSIAVNTIAMRLGTRTWIRRVVRALLLGTIQQIKTVTISLAISHLIVGAAGKFPASHLQERIAIRIACWKMCYRFWINVGKGNHVVTIAPVWKP